MNFPSSSLQGEKPLFTWMSLSIWSYVLSNPCVFQFLQLPLENSRLSKATRCSNLGSSCRYGLFSDQNCIIDLFLPLIQFLLIYSKRLTSSLSSFAWQGYFGCTWWLTSWPLHIEPLTDQDICLEKPLELVHPQILSSREASCRATHNTLASFCMLTRKLCHWSKEWHSNSWNQSV